MASARRGCLRVRGQVNRAVVVAALVVLFPMIAVAERVRAGAGRRIAGRGIRAVARLTGVAFDVTVDPATSALDRVVLVPNHSSPADIPAVLVARPDACFLAAAELFRIPLLRSAMRALRCVPVDRRHPAASRARFDRLTVAPGTDVAVFAEGGIGTGRLGDFKTGAFRLAITSGVPVVPVAIRGGGEVLGRGHRLRVRPGRISVELGAPMSTRGLSLADAGTLRDRTREAVGDLLDPPAVVTGAA